MCAVASSGKAHNFADSKVNFQHNDFHSNLIPEQGYFFSYELRISRNTYLCMFQVERSIWYMKTF